MELIKKMLKYLFILVIILVLACSLIAGILFFFPSVSLFGLRFASGHKENIAIETNSSIKKVNVETNHFNIIVKPNSDENKDSIDNENLRVVINNDYTGFSKNGLNTVQIKKVDTDEFLDASKFDNISLAHFKNGDELTIILNEPDGVISYGSSSVIVFLPENASGVEYNLKTNTGKISFEKNNFDETKVVSTKNITLSVSSAFGSFSLDNASMQDGSDLIISNYIGRVEINSEKIGNVKIKSNSGNFTFKQIGYEGFTGGNLTVEGNNPYVRVTGTVFGSVTYTNVTTGFVEIDTIKQHLIYESKNGILRVNKILGSVNIYNESGETTIKQIGDDMATPTSVTIKGKSGAINLGMDNTKIYYLSRVETESGRVVIKNLASSVSQEIQTTKGSVEVEFSEDENQKDLKVLTESGSVTLKKVYGKMNITTGNSSKIYAGIVAISSESNFVTDGGEVELVLPAPTTSANRKYKLAIMNKQKNKMDVKIGNFAKTEFDGEQDENQFYHFSQVFPQEETTENVINIKSNSGLIKVHE